MIHYMQFIIGLLTASAGANYIEDPNVSMFTGMLFLYGGGILVCYAAVRLMGRQG